MFRFENLEIWKLAIDYGKKSYKIALQFPREETYALSDQLRRASVSVSNNIAEGSGGTDKDFSKFLDISIKSVLETASILYFAKEQKYISEAERQLLYQDAETLIKKIRAFKNSIRNN